jgi:hypothetical protein
MKITRVGVDLAKNVFQVHGVNRAGCWWLAPLGTRAAGARVQGEADIAAVREAVSKKPEKRRQ